MNKVAVVVPMHNAEENLLECLDSIRNQTLKEISVICVDDGSSDGTAVVAESFAQRDERFILVQNEKCLGAGRTRNRGMEYANASYVVFWDADEYYCETLLEEMYSAAIKFDADVVLAERGILNAETQEILPESSFKYKNEDYIKNSFNIKELPLFSLGIWPSSPINRMVRKSLIDRYGIQFQDLRSSNDVFYADMTMLLAKKIVHIDNWEPMIYVRRNLVGSISSNRDPFCSFKAFSGIKERLIELGKWEEYQKYVCMHYVAAIFAELKKCKQEDMQREYFRFTKTEGLKHILGDENWSYMLCESKFAKQLTVFVNSDFEVRCWESDYKKRQILYENKERLRKVFTYFSAYSKKLVLWNCGSWTESFVEFVKTNYDLDISVIDNTQGCNADVILTVTKADYNVAYTYFCNLNTNKNVEIFALYEYFKIPEIVDCTKKITGVKTYVSNKEVNLVEEVDNLKMVSLPDNIERMEAIIQTIDYRGIKAAIWGDDKEVESIIRFCKENFQYQFKCAIIGNKAVVGRFKEIPLASISEVKNEIDMIFVTDSYDIDSLRKRIVNENPQIQLFLINEYLRTGKINNCIRSVILDKQEIRQVQARKRVASRIAENYDKVKDFIDAMKDKKVGLWGAGIWGDELTKYMAEHTPYRFFCVMDNNEFLVGSNINEVDVYNFYDVYDKLDVVVITNAKFYNEIATQVKSCDSRIELFELYRYLAGEDLDMCFS